MKIDGKDIRFFLNGVVCSDGDFTIDVNNFDEKFRKHLEQDICGDWIINVETDDEFYIRDFLEYLIVSWRVGSGHYWILKMLYEMTEKVKNCIWDNEERYVCESISGNYDGTELVLTKIEIDKDDTPTAPLVAKVKGKLVHFCCPRCKEEINMFNSCCTCCGKKIKWN